MSKQATPHSTARTVNLAQRLAALWRERGGKEVLDILEQMANEQSDSAVARALQAVRVSVRSGTALSKAMGNHEPIFGREFIAAVAAGEKGSDLPAKLEELSTGPPARQTQELLTLSEAAGFLYTSKPTMHRMLQRGELQGLKVGRQWRFRKSDLIAHMERQPPTVALATTVELDSALEILATRLGSRDFLQEAVTGGDEVKVVALVNGLIALALNHRASDIHIEPHLENMQVRYRVDGVLIPALELPLALHRPLIDRLKIMCNMDIATRNVPQDGRIHIKYQEKDFDLRIASCPSISGECIAIRLLAPESVVINLDRFSLAPQRLEQLRAWTRRPYGLILMTGPTGSGKTTTLYSLLMETADTSKKTITIEDPVEYTLPNTVQIHVNRKAGLTFASGLRSILRQDPDVIMIAEINSLEVAQIALQCALTGHLVLSTMHTDSAAGTVMRLIEMGIEPFLLNQALIGVVNQRLLRRIGPETAKQAIDPILLKQVKARAGAGGYVLSARPQFQSGVPAPENRHTGYRGRIPIQEVMEWSPSLGDTLYRNPTQQALTETAVENGMLTLLADGVRKAVEGETSLDEVLRVVGL